MIRLSVNINKIATLRNSRGGEVPDVLKAAVDCQRFGAQGITVHPRPDERHIRYADVRALKPLVMTEFNIEGNPRERRFVELVLEVRPDQVTLVPDATDQITSNHGWDTVACREELRGLVQTFRRAGIRTSIFVDPDVTMVRGAADTGTDRIELYTERYARDYPQGAATAVAPFAAAAREAQSLGLGLNAGHDLSLENLEHFARNVPGLLEVSIGHALISDALYLGLERSIAEYRRRLGQTV